MRRVTLWTAVAVLCVVVIVWWLKPSEMPTLKYVNGIEVSLKGRPTLGDSSSKVKMIEFADFNCPACKFFHDAILPKIKADYIDTGKLQLTFVNLTFRGPSSMTAALAARSVYHQNKDSFWQYYSAVYSNQGDEEKDWMQLPLLKVLTTNYVPNIDYSLLEKDVKSKKYLTEVKDDAAIAKAMGVDVAPCLFVGNKRLSTFSNYTEISRVIEEELTKS